VPQEERFGATPRSPSSEQSKSCADGTQPSPASTDYGLQELERASPSAKGNPRRAGPATTQWRVHGSPGYAPTPARASERSCSCGEDGQHHYRLWVIRITPEARAIKGRRARTVLLPEQRTWPLLRGKFPRYALSPECAAASPPYEHHERPDWPLVDPVSSSRRPFDEPTRVPFKSVSPPP